MSGKFIRLLLVLTVLFALGMAGLLSRVSSPAPVAAARWTGIAAPLPPEHAFQKALQRATEWQPDAILVRAEASWRPSERWLEARVLPVTWLFTFYSPSVKALTTVSVNAEKILWTPPMEVPYPPPALPDFPPPYGVDKMWMTFLAAGGEEFVRQDPDSLIHIVLQMTSEGPIWRITAIGRGSLKVQISAETGTLVP